MNVEITLVGLVIASFFVEIMGIYPGGIVVPVYIALYLDQPLRIVGTIAVSLICVLIYRLFSRKFILFGRRRFVFLLVLNGLLTLLWYRYMPFLFPGGEEFRTVGWIVPGLLSNVIERQGIVWTLVSMIAVAFCIYLIMKGFAMI